LEEGKERGMGTKIKARRVGGRQGKRDGDKSKRRDKSEAEGANEQSWNSSKNKKQR
jgi:hypothetical protein